MEREKPRDMKTLMQEQLKQRTAKLVDSPYAKYNSRGQLVCVVCGTTVKSAIIWQAHVNKRSHHDNLTKLKKQQQELNSRHAGQSRGGGGEGGGGGGGGQKRPGSPTPPQTGGHKKPAKDPQKPKGILKNMTMYGSSDDDSDDEDGAQPPLPTPPPTATTTDPTTTQVKTENGDSSNFQSGLPNGFFDEDVLKEDPLAVPKKEKEEGEEDESIYLEKPVKPKEPAKPNTTQILPEGFFDDPVADAKARKVEYRDKEAEEWQSFMREVTAAEQESRTIIEEDKEAAALTTQIEQASEQIAFLERVVELDREKSSQLRDRSGARPGSDSTQDSSDEEFAPVIWRTKNSLI